MTLDDDATLREEQDREAALLRRMPTLPHNGVCNWCGEPIEQGAFCGADCRDDYQRKERFNR